MKKRNKLLHNIGLKIMAVLFSVLLWLVVVNINDPVDRKSFRDLNVELKNVNVLTDEGKTYQVLDDTDTVTVTVRASRSVLEGISASDITAVADFSELSFTNTVPIRLSVNRYLENQITEISGSIDSVKLEVEDRIEKQLVIETSQVGQPADGYIVSKISLTDGNAMRISGPQSLIEQVSRAVVEVDLDELTDNINITERIRLLDAEGEEITDSRITRSVTTASVSVTILQTKVVPISLSVMGEPASGYVATGEITCAPETVTIAGRSSVISSVEAVTIPAEELDLTGATADVTKLIDVRNYLPEGISLTNTTEEFNGKAAVTVKIEPLVEISRSVNKELVTFSNVPEGYTVTADPDAHVNIRLRGLREDLEQVDVTALAGSVDVAAWMQENQMTELTEGTAEMEVTYQLPDGVTTAATVTIPVIIENITGGEAQEEA